MQHFSRADGLSRKFSHFFRHVYKYIPMVFRVGVLRIFSEFLRRLRNTHNVCVINIVSEAEVELAGFRDEYKIK